MALKGDRKIDSYRIDFYMDELATRGGVACYSTAGSGAALDQSTNLITYAANPSGKLPAGVVMEDMVNVDLTQYKLNQHKSQVQQGSKITTADRGWVVTNMLEGTITAPAIAYVGHSGLFAAAGANIAGAPVAGRFESTADEDGYAKVSFNIP